MSERNKVHLVRLLLETRYSYLPDPKTWTGQLVKNASLPGEKPTKKQRCGCEAGWVNGRRGPELCEKCDGRGFYLVDSYTGKREPESKPSSTLSGPERAAWRRRVASLEARVAADLCARAGEDDPSEIAWLRARKRLFRNGSYRQLDYRRELLRDRDTVLATRVESVYVNGWAAEDTGAIHGLLLLTSWMPDPVRVPAWLTSPSPKRIVDRRAA